jgi:PAS domain S-box-containing protein
MKTTGRIPVRVLILEDDPVDAELTQRAFDRSDVDLGATITTDRETFLAELRRDVFDVVIVDFSLPHWTGVEALRAVRAAGLEVPVILVTGTLSDQEALAYIKAGMADYVLKENLSRLPFVVLRVMQEAVSRRDASRAWNAFNQIAVSIDEIFFTVDLATQTTTYVNPAYERVFGRTLGDLRRDPQAFLDHVDAEDLDRLRAYIEAVRRGELVEKIEFRIRRADNEQRVLLAHAVSVADEKGEIVSISGIALDVTETRRLEQQFHHAQKMEAVGRLAGGIAHDFNNLLTVIISYTQFVREHLDAGGDRDDLAEVLTAAESAAALTRQLLAFSSQKVVEARIVDLGTVLRDVQGVLARVIGEDVVVTTAIAGDANVRVDRGKLEQVIMNLAVNARDAMPNGGELHLAVSMTAVGPEVARLHQAESGQYATLTVRDTGQGMTDATLRHAFEPFFTTKEPGKGTGLGLSTVYGIVKEANGFISVKSKLGQGTTFCLHFPASVESIEPQQGPEEVRATGGTETILLVEDAAAVRMALQVTLTQLGYTVIPAATGEAALTAMRRSGRPVDLLISDVIMPGMSGRDLATEFRKIHPHVPILFISGYTAGITLGDEPNTEYLQKPFTPDRLARKIRTTLERART